MDQYISKLAQTMNASLEGVVISDMRRPDEPIIYCNDTFLRMSGYEEEEVVGRNCRFLQKGDRDQPALHVLRSAIKAANPCKVVIRNYRKNGELFLNRLSLTPVFDDEGTLTHYIGIQDDITNIISTRKKLARKEKENEALLTEVHHRVKNNLAVMSSMLELEQNERSEADALEKSRLRVHSMSLIHELLYQKEGLALIDFSNFIKELTNRRHITDVETEINYNFDLHPVEVNINQAIPLSIIISELLHNISLHAYPESPKGRADISLNVYDEKVELTIRDYGTGLPETVNFDEPDTLGFSLIKTLLAQVDASTNVVEEKEGFGVTLSFIRSNKKGPSQNLRIEELS